MKMNLTDVDLKLERPHPNGLGGVQRFYRWGKWGLSLVNSPTYETPLTNDVEVFYSDEEANAFIGRAKHYFTTGKDSSDNGET